MKKFTAMLLAVLFAVAMCPSAAAAPDELEVIYEIDPDGNAQVAGFAGEGTEATISSEYDGHTVVRIADSAFEDCASLETVFLWADVEEIGAAAFKGCASLEDLIIWGDPDIGEYAFANCASLTSVSIGAETKNVGAHAFEGCAGLEDLIIWGAEIIGDYAFAGCSQLEDVSIPGEVLSVGNHAFDGCAKLEDVLVWSDGTAIGADAFANCPALTDAPAPRGTVLACTNAAPEAAAGSDAAASAEAPAASAEAPAEAAETPAAEGIRPEFKAAMDSYEAFYAEYCELLSEYAENPADLGLIVKYGEMMAKVGEMDEAFKAWDEEDLNSEELKYYLDVNTRVMQMLADVADAAG